MRYIKNIIIVCVLLLGMSACEKNLPLYETKECQLNFWYADDIQTDDVKEEMQNGSHSFVLNSGEGVEIDTFWLKVNSMGYLSDKDRPFDLQQVLTRENDAKAGEHYVPFDDSDLKSKYYYIPAGKSEVMVPIVLKRAPSLSTDGDVVLKITFKENDWFKLGYPEFSVYTITISDKLSKPTAWNICNLDYYFGAYGSVKHQLMISWTGKNWDDDYIKNILFYEYINNGTSWGWYPKDSDYVNYLQRWFAEKLESENTERLANPEIGDVYREADGNEVDFTPVR